MPDSDLPYAGVHECVVPAEEGSDFAAGLALPSEDVKCDSENRYGILNDKDEQGNVDKGAARKSMDGGRSGFEQHHVNAGESICQNNMYIPSVHNPQDSELSNPVDDKEDSTREIGVLVSSEHNSGELKQLTGHDKRKVTKTLTALEACHTDSKECSMAISTIRNKILRTSSFEGEKVKSRVEHWVNSSAQEESFKAKSRPQCSEKCPVGCERHVPFRSGHPLHRHFGYKSPAELFKKVTSSENAEQKVRSGTDSSPSSSSSPRNKYRREDAGALSVLLRARSLQRWTGGEANARRNNFSWETVFHGSAKKLLKRSLRIAKHAVLKRKSKVIVNGHVLSDANLRQAEERAGKLRPGSYWYDRKAGFWGVEGGPCRGILPPFIEEFNYPMVENCSAGDTQIYINGRELHSKDVLILSGRGLPLHAGKAYSLEFDGLLVDETTGLDVTHFGKLAPTVERNGRGFGMFAGARPLVKTPTE
ncbi:hypothetical protein KP509_06G026900 [Ceratopteris richardii]|uniref:Uncharacterized protein n=1 Tax=Ceratopteris richardii TaxID=49495 RepID=A0A8T2UEF3_CERRI|nr:hypothetical protein KP509_06G026900 [Ceratopteris richardii]